MFKLNIHINICDLASLITSSKMCTRSSRLKISGCSNLSLLNIFNNSKVKEYEWVKRVGAENQGKSTHQVKGWEIPPTLHPLTYRGPFHFTVGGDLLGTGT